MKGIKHWHLVIQKSNSLPQKKDSKGFVVNLQQHRDFVIWLNRFFKQVPNFPHDLGHIFGASIIILGANKFPKGRFFCKKHAVPLGPSFSQTVRTRYDFEITMFHHAFFCKK